MPLNKMKIANTTMIVITHRMGISPLPQDCHHAGWHGLPHFGDSEAIFERHLSRPQVPSQVTLPEECRRGRENISGASCPVIWKRQETQGAFTGLLRERGSEPVITGIDEFVPLEFAWCSGSDAADLTSHEASRLSPWQAIC